MSRAKVTEAFESSIALRTQLLADAQFISAVQSVAQRLKTILHSGGTIYACGNGGSACDSQHLVEELVARFKRDRPGFRAMHFLDPAVLTCWSNDVAYEDVFARQARTFCGPKDALVLISTSGKSNNVVQAAKAAREKGAYLVGLLGRDGGTLKDLVDTALIVPHESSERIQEVHITLIHIFCEIIECD